MAAFDVSMTLFDAVFSAPAANAGFGGSDSWN
jgi:hypothetical protein